MPRDNTARRRSLLVIATVAVSGVKQAPSMWSVARDLGYDLHFAAADDGWSAELPADVQFHPLSASRQPSPHSVVTFASDIRRLVTERQWDLIQIQTAIPATLYRMVAPRQLRRRTIYIVHGFHFAPGTPPWKNLPFKAIEMVMAHRTGAIALINDWDAAWLAKIPSFLKPRIVSQLPGAGIDIAAFSPQTGTARLHRALFVGELNRNKDPLHAINVVRELREHAYMLDLVIIGTGPLRADIEELARQHSWITYVERTDDVAGWMATSELLLAPSYREGLPRVVMEAMASGLPVLARANRGTTQLLRAFPESLLSQKATVSDWRDAAEHLLQHLPCTSKYKAEVAQYDTSHFNREYHALLQAAARLRGSRRTGLAIFSEARAEIDSFGNIRSENQRLYHSNWRRDLPPELDAALILRATNTDHTTGQIITGKTIPLPWYRGPRHFLSTLPSLTVSIWRVVLQSESVLIQLPGVIGLIAGCAATIARRPFAVEVLGDAHESLIAILHRYPIARSIVAGTFELLTRLTVRRATAVRYVTEHTLQERYPPSPRAFTVSFSDVQLAQWITEPTAPIASVPTIIAVGSQNVPYKGHDVLIRSLAHIERNRPTRLSLVGDGQLRNDLKRLATSLGVRDQVDFVGYVSEVAELRSLIDQAWVFIMPSRTEGLPRALIEAMARGKCCVGSNVGGIPELLPPDRLVEPGNHLALAQLLSHLLDSPTTRARDYARNREVASHYSSDATASEAEKWIRCLLAMSETPGRFVYGGAQQHTDQLRVE